MTTCATDELPPVDGRTRLYGTVGDPIGHVKSPELLTACFRAAGANAVVVPIQVSSGVFEAAMPGLKMIDNLHGLIITLPFKTRAIAFVDRLFQTAKRVGAVNAIRRDLAEGTWIGDMFDGKGVLRSLRERHITPKGLRVMLLGAGGAGSAIADAVAQGGAARLSIFDIDQAKAHDLAGQISRDHPTCLAAVGPPTTVDQDILINATPLGLRPEDDLSAAVGPLDPALIVIDIVIAAGGTRLIRNADIAGCRTIDGQAVLEGQAAELIGFFGGAPDVSA